MKTAERLQAAIWKTDTKALRISALPPRRKHQSIANIDGNAFEPVDHYPQHWGRLFDQRWFRLEVTPEQIPEGSYLSWQDEGEATLYSDSLPWVGIDVAHPYAPLPDVFENLYIESICAQGAIWHPTRTGISQSGSKLLGAYLAQRDDEAWHAYHDFVILLETLGELAKRDGFDVEDFFRHERFRRPLERVHPAVRQLIQALDRVVDQFNEQGITAARKELAETYERFRGADKSIDITLTGHAHIDLVWLWPERIGQAKAIHTFATANRLMDMYPEFMFGYSQPASYEAVARRSPELWQSVQGRMLNGRWEATGTLYVESDTQLPCGEALARGFILGQKWFIENTGSPSSVVWLPDVFGYTSCLPSIMRQTGARYFFTTKQAWSSATRFPHSCFRWRGADGSEVTAYVLNNLSENCYNTGVACHEILDAAYCQQQASQFPEALLPAGYGDGGGGPTAEMCERARRLSDLSGMPATKWGRIDAFFDRLQKVKDDLPHWKGEIYLEYHRGVQTTHVALKQAFREAERSLQILEATACLSSKGPIHRRYWERMVFSQFHDYIPGSSIMEVYEEGIPELQELAENALKEAEENLSSPGSKPAYFNPLPLSRWETVRPGDEPIPIEFAPFGVVSNFKRQSKLPFQDPQADEQTLSNEFVRAQLCPDTGGILSLNFGGHEIAIDEPLNQFALFHDNPARYDAWEIDRTDFQHHLAPRGKAKFDCCTANEYEASATFSLELTAKSSAEITYSISRYDAALRISYSIDWQDSNMLLKTCFPTRYYGKNARFGAPFGSVQRPQDDGTLAADAQFETPASRWALVGDDLEQDGLTIISKDRYGFGCQEGNLHVSLVRSARITESEMNPELRDLQYKQPYSDLGSHSFELALAWGGLSAKRENQPATLAQTLFTPPLFIKSLDPSIIVPEIELVGGDTLIPEWIKPAENGNGWILRLHETRGIAGRSRITLPPTFRVFKTDLSESTNTQLSEPCDISFNPYEIVSLLLERAE